MPNNSKLGPCLAIDLVTSYVGSLYPLPVAIILISVTVPPWIDASSCAVCILLRPIKSSSASVSIL